MAAIAGIAALNRKNQVDRMLERMAHRGGAGRLVRETGGVTLGIAWPPAQPRADRALLERATVSDEVAAGQFARAQAAGVTLTLARDPLGVAPLYFGRTPADELCFASEVKALLAIEATAIRELPPGHTWQNGALAEYYRLSQPEELEEGPPHQVAARLRRLLQASVERFAGRGVEFGAWLSGGLDSSVLAALARPLTPVLHTFAAGLAGAPDLHYARLVAGHLHAEHHELIVTLEDLLLAVPKVIFHLESFDALLVRSSLMNYLVSREAGRYVPAAFSGEGGDELFAGYEYLKALPLEQLPAELLDITGRLHNTALQRVDRSAAAGGIAPYVAFLDPDVVDYALRIPPGLKIRGGVEKWILRQALEGALPEEVLKRPKAKFWQGAGVEDLLETYAGEHIGDAEFARHRRLPNGWLLNSKEELFYYRAFRDQFGPLADLEWMGRTKGAPRAAEESV
ncbi:asparagine synthase [bacterium]|nr:MAG: asparagine synthase [bacterium]